MFCFKVTEFDTSDALQISTSKFFNIWLLKWHQDPWVWCNQHQLQRSGQTPLDDARSEGHDEVVKILENAESWLHTCVNKSRSFVSESETSSKTQLHSEAWSLNVCAWSNSAVGAISGLMVRPSCFTRPSSNHANIFARTNRLLFCEVQNWRNMFLIWALFLLSQLCFDHGNDTLSASLLEFPSNHIVCFKCLESSCCFLAHRGSSLGRLKSSLGRHVQVTNLPAC